MLIQAYSEIEIPLGLYTVGNIQNQEKINNDNGINFKKVSEEIKHWASKTLVKSRFVHPLFEDFLAHIKNDYYRFIEAEVTGISTHARRKVPAMKDLILYCSSVPNCWSIDCQVLITRKKFNIPERIYHKNKDHLNIEDKSTYGEVHKLKQKYSQMCYMEQYDKLNIDFFWTHDSWTIHRT